MGCLDMPDKPLSYVLCIHLADCSSDQLLDVHNFIIPILQIRILWCMKIKQFAQGRTASKLDSEPASDCWVFKAWSRSPTFAVMAWDGLHWLRAESIIFSQLCMQWCHVGNLELARNIDTTGTGKHYESGLFSYGYIVGKDLPPEH